MNAKLFFTILFATVTLFAFSSEPNGEEAKSEVQILWLKNKNGYRSIFNYHFSVSDKNNHLQFVFHSFLSDSNILITDANGSIVAFDSNVDIYDGMSVTIPIYNETAYPYYVEISSPTLDIEAEITQKE